MMVRPSRWKVHEDNFILDERRWLAVVRQLIRDNDLPIAKVPLDVLATSSEFVVVLGQSGMLAKAQVNPLA